MPDGKQYKGMRGGCWYNGDIVNGIDDGHSRVSNRNPSYFRGPQDPNHPWYHIGFRVARNYENQSTGITIPTSEKNYLKVFPNPCKEIAKIQFNNDLSTSASIKIYNETGQQVDELTDKNGENNTHYAEWNTKIHPSGLYLIRLITDNTITTTRVLVQK
jgi:hypothetical protein